MDAFNMMGKPIPLVARDKGYAECRIMGLNQAEAVECVGSMSEQLERDQPYEAQAAAMKFLDLIGAYRLMAVLLTETLRDEQAKS